VLSVSALDNATLRVASDFNSIRYSPYSPDRRVVFNGLWTLKSCFAALNLDAAATSGPSELYRCSRKRGELPSAPILTRELQRFGCISELRRDVEARAGIVDARHVFRVLSSQVWRTLGHAISLSELMILRNFPELGKRTRRRDGGG
jgi:hypothetical protein